MKSNEMVNGNRDYIEVCGSIIENFINYFTSDDKERTDMLMVLEDYNENVLKEDVADHC